MSALAGALAGCGIGALIAMATRIPIWRLAVLGVALGGLAGWSKRPTTPPLDESARHNFSPPLPSSVSSGSAP